ncbi:class A beta-lactamase-related serine hydrolase [Lysinibacillus capsici]|uniref:serine hydrolase n=1 Tax=Lysinibacillus capsici TaxID=2115968 RepID=UPI0021D8E2BA|nr:serine hydrolase [Lysinibacillus capsici]UYB49238.1 class A beta-lactamase-related serine hydrolase [Lysinibacillus capsici]
MEQRITTLIQESPYKVHLFIKNLTTNQLLIGHQLEASFSSASLIKVPILLALLSHIEKNKLSLDSTLMISPADWVDFSVISEQRLTQSTFYDLLVWMIITSDNTATNVLINVVGMAYLNDYFQHIGLQDTLLQRKMMDVDRLAKGVDNRTSARDMAHLYTRIYQQELLSPPYNKLVIDILSRQRVHDSLKRYLIDDVRLAHKTGGLDTIDHDVGIFYTNAVDYSMGVFITNVTDNDQARQLIGRLSKVVYDQLVKRKGEKDEGYRYSHDC